ncbi:WSC domain-containing protein, partial [Massilia sp. CT11-108]|uniref:WSC domain-containing protein n=1 Tax=Massilia sp. CT11-108 TaxID=3393900 RepID=UPI0039A55C68
MPGRALTGASTASNSMTIETCLQYCGARGFQLAGVQYGRECRCGNSFDNSASLSLKSNACGMPCAG